jgi:hypothetical protein
MAEVRLERRFRHPECAASIGQRQPTFDAGQGPERVGQPMFAKLGRFDRGHDGGSARAAGQGLPCLESGLRPARAP